MKKLFLLLTLASSGIITAMDSLERQIKPRVMPSVIPGDLVHVWRREASTPLQKLRFAVLCCDGDYFNEMLPTITKLNQRDAEDYKALFLSIMLTSSEAAVRKMLDHTVMLLNSPESAPHLSWLTNTLLIIEHMVNIRIPLSLTILLEYIDSGAIPNNLSVNSSWITNLKGLIVERLLRGGQFDHLLLLCDRGILSRNQCSTSLARETLSNLERVEKESEYRCDIANRQLRYITACWEFMELIRNHRVNGLKEALSDAGCPVNGRIQAYGEISPLTQASIMLMKCKEGDTETRKAAEEMLALLLNHKDVDPNLACANNMPPICYAAQYKNPSESRAFEVLMESHNTGKKPLNLNALCMRNKSTAIMYALTRLNEAFFTLLAHKDVNIHLLQEGGKHLMDILNELHIEGMFTNEERQRAFFGLIERGACPQEALAAAFLNQPLPALNDRNTNKWHALSIAAYKGDGDAVRLLLSDHDILPFPKTATGLTPYKLALIGAYMRSTKKHVKINPDTVVQDIPRTPSAALDVLDEFYECRKAAVYGMQLWAKRSGIPLNEDMQRRLADSYRFGKPVEESVKK